MSDDFVVVTSYTEVWFFDKGGRLLGSKGAGKLQNPVDTWTLFANLHDPRDPEEMNAPQQLRLPTSNSGTCDPEHPLAAGSYCMNFFYDTRARYDPIRKRFWILSTVRNQRAYDDAGRGKEVNPLAFRDKIAVAVSRTEDPRDGFYEYWWDADSACLTNGSCGHFHATPGQGIDYPCFEITDRYLIVSAGVGGRKEVPAPHTPLLDIVPVEPLVRGEAGNGWRYWNIKGPGGEPFRYSLTPVAAREARSDEMQLVTTQFREGLLVWAFTPREAAPPPLHPLYIPLGNIHRPSMAPMPGTTEQLDFTNVGNLPWRAIQQDEKLYAVAEDCLPGPPGCSAAVRIIRVDVSGGALLTRTARIPARNTPFAESAPEINRVVGVRAPGDDPDDIVSYGDPGIEVTRNGDMVVMFVRSSARIFPEVRYSVFKHDETDLRPSALLQTGTMAVGGHWDTAGIALDPADGLTVWMAQLYGARMGRALSLIVGRARP